MTYASLAERPIPILMSFGMSDIAEDLAAIWEEHFASVQITCSSNCVDWGLAKSDFVEIIGEAAEDDWDGYGAKAVNPKSVITAEHFLDAAKIFGGPPEINAVPSGHISFIYRESKNPRNYIHLIVTENEIHYAFKKGRAEGGGKGPFESDVPENVSKLIQEIFTAG